MAAPSNGTPASSAAGAPASASTPAVPAHLLLLEGIPELSFAPVEWGVGTITHYHTHTQIGEGTYGKVFKAVDSRNKEVVALKKMVRHHEKDGFPKTETREIKILRSLSHPNMVNLREVVSSLGAPNDVVTATAPANDAGAPTLCDRVGDIYMVFDYVDYDLAGLMDGGYLFSAPQVKSIVYQLLVVLEFLHARGYVHRDLKCSNLLLSDTTVLKLADFGLARSILQGDPSRLTNNVITLWYRPPELLLGDTEYNATVDMWSVGCILAELLIGKPIFPARTESEALKHVFSVVGTPPAGSWMRNLPVWRKTEQEERQSRLVEWLQRHQALRDPELLHLLTKLLECDPRKRIDAKEALRARWFDAEPRINKMRPTEGLPRISDAPGFQRAVDHHEYAAKKRRRSQAASDAASAPGASVPSQKPGDASITSGAAPVGAPAPSRATDQPTVEHHIQRLLARIGELAAADVMSARDPRAEMQQLIRDIDGVMAAIDVSDIPLAHKPAAREPLEAARLRLSQLCDAYTEPSHGPGAREAPRHFRGERRFPVDQRREMPSEAYAEHRAPGTGPEQRARGAGYWTGPMPHPGNRDAERPLRSRESDARRGSDLRTDRGYQGPRLREPATERADMQHAQVPTVRGPESAQAGRVAADERSGTERDRAYAARRDDARWDVRDAGRVTEDDVARVSHSASFPSKGSRDDSEPVRVRDQGRLADDARADYRNQPAARYHDDRHLARDEPARAHDEWHGDGRSGGRRLMPTNEDRFVRDDNAFGGEPRAREDARRAAPDARGRDDRVRPLDIDHGRRGDDVRLRESTRPSHRDERGPEGRSVVADRGASESLAVHRESGRADRVDRRTSTGYEDIRDRKRDEPPRADYRERERPGDEYEHERSRMRERDRGLDRERDRDRGRESEYDRDRDRPRESAHRARPVEPAWRRGDEREADRRRSRSPLRRERSPHRSPPRERSRYDRDDRRSPGGRRDHHDDRRDRW